MVLIVTLAVLPGAVVIVLAVLLVLAARRGRSWRFRIGAVLVATVVFGGVVAAQWSALAEPERLQSFREDGSRTLSVTYAGGICEDQRSVSVDESDRAVTVGIRTRDFDSSCADVGQLHTVRVELKGPLGSRTVVDDNCGDRDTCSVKREGKR